MTLARHELARRAGGDCVMRHQAMPFTVEFKPAISRDGHEIIVTFEAAMRLVDRPADVELFNEQFFAGRDVVTIDQIRQRLIPLLEGTLREFAAQHEAASYSGMRAPIEQLLLGRANEIGFGCGLEFLPPVQLTIHCPAVENRRVIEQVERQREEQIDRAADILVRVRKIGSADSLRTDEQATLLQLLLRSAPLAPVLMACGSKLIRYQPHSGETTIITPPPGLGPLRSVQIADTPTGHQIILGGRTGAAVLGADDQSTLYPLAGQSDRGINSAVLDIRSGQLIAAHTELGLLRWNIETAESLATINPPVAARSLVRVGDRVLAACGSDVVALDAESATIVQSGSGQIVALLATADSLWVIRETGAIDRYARSDPAHRLGGFIRSNRLLAAEVIKIEGLSVMALAGESGPIELVSTTGAPLLELHGTYHGIRALAHAGRHIAGISADRQQLIVWDTQRPEAPARIVNILARFGNRITDIC